jgi:hypothetical protein
MIAAAAQAVAVEAAAGRDTRRIATIGAASGCDDFQRVGSSSSRHRCRCHGHGALSSFRNRRSRRVG